MTDMTATTPTRILVVEDEMIISKDIQRSLRRLGYEVAGTAASGPDALEKAQATRPDLVLMDIHIQGDMDGIDTAQQMRERLAIPVVYLTAFADGPTLERAKLTEPYGYLIKPFEERELSVTIEMGLAKHGMEQRLKASERRFRRLVEQAADALFTHDREGRLLDVNRRACESLGYSREELLQMTVMDIEVGVDRPQLDAIWQQLTPDAPATANGRHRRKDGTTFPVEVRVGFIEADGQQAMLALVRDVTERERVQHSLRQAQVALQETNAALEQRVAERTAALVQANEALLHSTEEAERAKDEAERANRAKSEFLSRMSHELRTPMNAILGFGQLLEMGELDAEQREAVEHILQGGRHLLKLIDEVLDIARIEAERLSLSPEMVCAGEVIRESLNLVQHLAAQRKIAFHLELGGTDEQYVLADRQRLKQVILNLLSNAVKYNRDGGSVTVACVVVGSEVVRSRGGAGEIVAPPHHLTTAPPHYLRIEVRDTGAGIAPDQLEKLFIPFERLGAEQSAIEGTGLGLAVSKRLMGMMDGQIGVRSTPGQGTTFWVELPLTPHPALPASAELEQEVERSEPPSTRRLLLYIEDNLPNVTLIQHILGRRPEVRLLLASEGRQGLELAREHHPHLILLDLHLPDILGDEVLRQLQANPETRDIPVVMISADATPRQIERLLAAGARAYLTKPFDVRQFLQVVQENLDAGDEKLR